MEKEFVTYEQALALKDLGFDEPCLASYETAFGRDIDFELGYIINGPKNYVLSPLKQQVFRWFREKYKLLGYIDSSTEPYGIEYSYNINILKEGNSWFQLYIETYEDAENQCIDRLIELVKKKQDEETK